MAFKYESAVPWGRSFDEYCRMFALSASDLELRILGCADGPAGFNAEMSRQGHRVVSCDPLYQFTAAQIQERIDATYQEVIGQTRRNQERFVWNSIPSVDALGQIRMAAMSNFLDDYAQGALEGRYVTAELPSLPFQAASFDLALCSHFLFLYSDNFSCEFHFQAIQAMCYVAHEARIFPLLTYNAEPSPHLEPLGAQLKVAGYDAVIETVPYEFQRGGNKMLRVKSENKNPKLVLSQVEGS